MAAMSTLRIEAAGDFDHHAALGTLAAHRIKGLERVDTGSGRVHRFLEIGDAAHLVHLRFDAAGIHVRTDTTEAGVLALIRGRIRRWFDLDTDLGPVNRHLGADPVLAPQVRARPGIGITGYVSAFEAALRVVLAQQVTLAAARLFSARLVAAYGAAPATGPPGLRVFPTAPVLAGQHPEQVRQNLGLTRSRAQTVQAVARLFADRDRDPELMPPAEQLAAVPGIGPWTLACLAIRGEGRPDAFPASDAVLRRVLRDAGVDDVPATIASWSPYRSYAAVRLWVLGTQVTATGR